MSEPSGPSCDEASHISEEEAEHHREALISRLLSVNTIASLDEAVQALVTLKSDVFSLNEGEEEEGGAAWCNTADSNERRKTSSSGGCLAVGVWGVAACLVHSLVGAVCMLRVCGGCGAR